MNTKILKFVSEGIEKSYENGRQSGYIHALRDILNILQVKDKVTLKDIDGLLRPRQAGEKS